MLTACKENKQQSDTTSTKMIVGTSADNPPYEFFQSGKFVGFDIALMEEVAKELKTEIEFKDMNFDGILGSLTSGRIDAAIATITNSEERGKSVDFSNGYYVATKSLVCLNDTTVKSETNLENQTIGVQAGSVHELYANGDLKKKIPTIKIKSLPRIPDLIQDLKAKRIACMMVGTKEAQALITETPDLTSITLEDTKEAFAIALPKGSSLTEKINGALENLEKKGTIEALKKKWLKD